MRPFLILAPLLLSACMAEPEMPSGAMAFAENCAACHGADARGSLANGIALETPAPDLHRISARHGGAFPRDLVMSTIDGYRRDPRFSTEMPLFGEGDLGPLILVETPEGTATPVPAVLMALADYLEGLQED